MDDKYFYDFLIKIQAISKIGLVFSKDPYALTNYQEINDLSTKYLEDFTNVKFDRPNYFERNIYPTPNVSVRTVIFNEDKTKVLLVREAAFGEYSLPGGWSDLYDSPSQTAINECKQEAGADIEIVRLVGIMNRTPFKQPTSVPEYVVIFEAKLKGELGDALDLLLAGYHHIVMEEYLAETVPSLYTKEGLEKAGFPAEGDE